jgi:tripartite-type tricarboxylate transporter receptor subunit TctC
MKRFALLMLSMIFFAGPALAEAYPTKPVRLMVGFSAGGPTDLVARIIAQQLTEKFKQPFIVENRPGGNGAVAAQIVISSPPDGYTLLVGTSGALTVNPATSKSMSYHPLKDLTPICLVAGYPYALVVPTDLPVTDVRGLVGYVKKNPGKISFSSSGAGSVNHLAGEWFRSLTNTDIVHVAYKGDAPALTDLIAGRVQMGFNTTTTSMPQVRTGKLRALAVTSEKRTTLAPDVPTMAEQGYPGFVVEPWNGLLGPANMPKELVKRINDAIAEILRRPAIQAKVTEAGQYVIIENPETFKRRMEQQTERWKKIALDAGVQPE